MDDLAEKIQEILEDPGKLQQVMNLASALGVDAPPEAPAEVSSRQSGCRSSRQAALVQALLPYLRPSRRERLQRAVRVAQLSNLGSLMTQAGSPVRPPEEDGHV